MKILCAISGLEFKVQYFPGYLTSRELAHPVFALPQHKLLRYAAKYDEGGIVAEDAYLLYLALFNSTDLVEWRVPAQRSAELDAVIAQCMESAFAVIGKMATIASPAYKPPQFVCSPDTKTFLNSSYWLDLWEQSIEEFESGYRSYRESRELINRETALDKLIKDANKNINQYAHILADWAAIAASFPTYDMRISPSRTEVCADYWKEIVVACTKSERIFNIPEAHIEKLIEHCEDNINHGSIIAHALMSLLRKGVNRKRDYLGLDDIDDSPSAYFKILDADNSTEDANIVALINEVATGAAPVRSAYKTTFEYLKAKTKYDMACKYSGTATATMYSKIGEI